MATSEAPEVPRDRWGRPLIPDPDTGVVCPYTRASTLSKAIDNGGGLFDWKVGKFIQGLRIEPGLLDLALPPKEIAELALDLAGGNLAAEAGTRLHALTEDLDRGVWPAEADEDDTGDRLRCYAAATQVLTVIGIELFVANLELQSAGTLDRIVAHQGRLYIADIKTGRDAAKYSHSAAVQMSVYARSRRWDPVTGWGGSLAEAGVDLNRAILIALPATGEPSCSLHWVDIAEGHRMARVAAAVRDWRRTSPATVLAEAVAL